MEDYTHDYIHVHTCTAVYICIYVHISDKTNYYVHFRFAILKVAGKVEICTHTKSIVYS